MESVQFGAPRKALSIFVLCACLTVKRPRVKSQNQGFWNGKESRALSTHLQAILIRNPDLNTFAGDPPRRRLDDPSHNLAFFHVPGSINHQELSGDEPG